jgi:hypothetical protein
VAQGSLVTTRLCDSWGFYVERSEKLLKKVVKHFFGGKFMEIGVRPKKGRQTFGRTPLSKFLNTPLYEGNAKNSPT